MSLQTPKDPEASEEAVSQGEGGAGLPLLPALRQDLPRGHSAPTPTSWRAPTGRARRGRGDLRGDRGGGLEEWLAGIRKDLSRRRIRPATGATGDDPEARRRRAAARYSDDPGPGGADRRQAGAGADLRGGPRSHCLWLPAEAERASTRSRKCTRCSAAATPMWWTPICRSISTTIPHRDLMRSVARRIVDRHVLRLIKMWLKSAGRGAG